jgi:hypothetical protein
MYNSPRDDVDYGDEGDEEEEVNDNKVVGSSQTRTVKMEPNRRVIIFIYLLKNSIFFISYIYIYFNYFLPVD